MGLHEPSLLAFIIFNRPQQPLRRPVVVGAVVLGEGPHDEPLD